MEAVSFDLDARRDQYDCSTCEQQRFRNCKFLYDDIEEGYLFEHTYLGPEHSTEHCPISERSAATLYYLQVFNAHRALKVMPREGGLFDQDADDVDAMLLIDREINRIEKVKRESEKK